MKLKLSISTCPNDTFMFDAMLHRRIDTEGLDFDLTMADIEQLNAAALAGEPDVTKLSYASFPLVADRYRILGSGSALGRGNGPLLVSRHKLYPDELRDARIAIPGEHTTANRLLSLFFPEASDKRVYLFSDIADAVLSDECDAGVLIHEGRFTYRGKGLRLVADLGESGRNALRCRCRSEPSSFRADWTSNWPGRSSAYCAAAWNTPLLIPKHRPASCAAMPKN